MAVGADDVELVVALFDLFDLFALFALFDPRRQGRQLPVTPLTRWRM